MRLWAESCCISVRRRPRTGDAPLTQAAPSLAPLVLVLAAAVAVPAPVLALERIELTLPLLATTFTIRPDELSEARALLWGHSDLAELDQATRGAIGRRMVELFNTPLPLQALDVADRVVPSPLAQQALLLLSSLGGVDGLPADLSSDTVLQVLDQVSGRGSLAMLGVLQAVPGRTATADVGKSLLLLQRLNGQLRSATRRLEGETPATVDPALAGPAPLTVQGAP